MSQGNNHSQERSYQGDDYRQDSTADARNKKNIKTFAKFYNKMNGSKSGVQEITGENFKYSYNKNQLRMPTDSEEQYAKNLHGPTS